MQNPPPPLMHIIASTSPNLTQPAEMNAAGAPAIILLSLFFCFPPPPPAPAAGPIFITMSVHVLYSFFPPTLELKMTMSIPVRGPTGRIMHVDHPPSAPAGKDFWQRHGCRAPAIPSPGRAWEEVGGWGFIKRQRAIMEAMHNTTLASPGVPKFSGLLIHGLVVLRGWLRQSRARGQRPERRRRITTTTTKEPALLIPP